MHMCRGYPKGPDLPEYPKAPMSSCPALAKALDQSRIDAVRLEDAPRYNDLGMVLVHFREAIVIFGSVASGSLPGVPGVTG